MHLVFGVRSACGTVFSCRAANSRARSDILATLRHSHPRLYLLDSDLPQVKKAIALDPVIKEWYDELEGVAEKMLTEPPAEYKLTGPRLLSQSRAALRRISTLAGLYRLDGDRRKAERARRELLAISAFPDWHPPLVCLVSLRRNPLARQNWLRIRREASGRRIGPLRREQSVNPRIRQSSNPSTLLSPDARAVYSRTQRPGERPWKRCW